MHPPPLLSTRPPAAQAVLVAVVPAAFGAFAGLALGASAALYLVLSLLGIAGGYFAGLEHRGAREGAVRGAIGGTLFGAFILLAHAARGAEAQVELPHPELLLVAVTAAFGIGLGALGGRSRLRRESGGARGISGSDAPTGAGAPGAGPSGAGPASAGGPPGPPAVPEPPPPAAPEPEPPAAAPEPQRETVPAAAPEPQRETVPAAAPAPRRAYDRVAATGAAQGSPAWTALFAIAVALVAASVLLTLLTLLGGLEGL